jgi:hypothetical protein
MKSQAMLYKFPINSELCIYMWEDVTRDRFCYDYDGTATDFNLDNNERRHLLFHLFRRTLSKLFMEGYEKL